jgi:hypothetical protein
VEAQRRAGDESVPRGEVRDRCPVQEQPGFLLPFAAGEFRNATECMEWRRVRAGDLRGAEGHRGSMPRATAAEKKVGGTRHCANRIVVAAPLALE